MVLPARDIASLLDKKVQVYLVDEDVRELGLDDVELIEGVNRIGRADIAALFGGYDQVWQW